MKVGVITYSSEPSGFGTCGLRHRLGTASALDVFHNNVSCMIRERCGAIDRRKTSLAAARTRVGDERDDRRSV